MRRQWGNIFKTHKEPTYLSKAKAKTGIFRHAKSERIHHEQNHTIRNVKGSLSDKRKMIPNGTVDPHKEWKVLEIVIT